MTTIKLIMIIVNVILALIATIMMAMGLVQNNILSLRISVPSLILIIGNLFALISKDEQSD